MIKPKYYIFPPFPYKSWLPYVLFALFVAAIFFAWGYIDETEKLIKNCKGD